MHSILPFIINFIFFGLIVLFITYFKMRIGFFSTVDSVLSYSFSKKIFFIKVKLVNSFFSFSPLLLAVFASLLFVTPNTYYVNSVPSSNYDHMLLGAALLYLAIDIILFVDNMKQDNKINIPNIINSLFLLFIFLIGITNILILDITSPLGYGYHIISYVLLWMIIMQKNCYLLISKINGAWLVSLLVYFVFFQFFNTSLIEISLVNSFESSILSFFIVLAVVVVEILLSLFVQKIFSRIVIGQSFNESYKVLLLLAFVLILIEGRLLLW